MARVQEYGDPIGLAHNFTLSLGHGRAGYDGVKFSEQIVFLVLPMYIS